MSVILAPHVGAVTKGPELMSKVRQVGAFVLNGGLEEIVAVTTLHRHFPIPSDKALLDRVDITAEAIATGLVPIDEATRHQASLWGFTRDGIAVTLSWSDGVPADDQLTAAVEAVGAFLAEAELTTVLALLPRRTPFPVGTGKILLEKTNEKACTQRTIVAERSDVPEELDAAWYFTLGDASRARGSIQPDDVIPVVMRGCDPGCIPTTKG